MNEKSNSNIFWGVILILLGFAFLADQFTSFSFGRSVGIIWPLVISGIGIYLLSKNPKNRGAYILIFIGLLFLVGSITSLNVWSLWPLILIFIGVTTLIGWGKNQTFNTGNTFSTEESVQDSVVFWGLDKKVTSQNFKGGEVTAVFGGVKLDLREAKLAEGASLEVNAIFGGIEIEVSPTMNVSNNGTGIFGGFSNRVALKPESKEVLRLTGSAVFGGVEVK